MILLLLEIILLRAAGPGVVARGILRTDGQDVGKVSDELLVNDEAEEETTPIIPPRDGGGTVQQRRTMLLPNEASAKKIAEKVQRQQEGKETAMLPKEHEDETFLTVDEIAKLLDAQLTENAKGKSAFFRSANSKEEKEMLANWFIERSKYIPLRLSYEERKYLRLVKATMNGAEYTDLIDGRVFKSDNRRQGEVVRCIGATLTGLVTALNHRVGQKLAEERNFSKYEDSIQTIFEITRRYKIMNPEKCGQHMVK